MEGTQISADRLYDLKFSLVLVQEIAEGPE